MSTELGKAYVQIVPSARGIGSALTAELNGSADIAGASAGSRIVGKLKGAFATLGLGKILMESLKEGANLEQALGGVETLFKDHADEVIANADKAWKTAGISANNYMELATSFSASLLSGLGGDTKKAAKITDVAISDMADNANKFGTDMESIQNAYQGFAKQNYTMLDNLKLGYGQSKTEMERLLSDAEKLSGQKYDISNLSDVYSAIHVIQENLGVTGTTAKEAATTLSGSFASMKSAYLNFIGDLTAGRNIDSATKSLAESFSTFLFKNLVPALGRIIASLPTVVFTLITDGLPALFGSLVKAIPQIIGTLADTIQSIADYITEGVNRFADDPSVGLAGLKMIKNFFVAIFKSIPALLKSLMNLLTAAMEGLSTILGTLFVKGVNKMLSPFKRAYNTIKGWVQKIKNLFNFTLKFNGIKLPHITVNWKKSGALGKIASKLGLPGVPDFGVNWYKTGGIFDQPSIIGVGEAGKEAVIPLDKLSDYTQNASAEIDYNRLASAIAYQLAGEQQEIIVQIDGDVLVRKTAPRFKKALNTLDTRSQRKLGYSG